MRKKFEERCIKKIKKEKNERKSLKENEILCLKGNRK